MGRWNAEIMRLSGLSRFFAKKFLGAGIFGKASWDEAISNMEKAVELDPGRIYHRLELAEIYADRKRYADAKEQLDRIRNLPDRELMDPVYRRRATDLAKKLADRQVTRRYSSRASRTSSVARSSPSSSLRRRRLSSLRTRAAWAPARSSPSSVSSRSRLRPRLSCLRVFSPR